MSTMSAKIAKLIAKADSTSHPEEAATFMAKAHKLMTEHGLSLLELGKLGDDALGTAQDSISISSAYSWGHKVVTQLSFYYGCRITFYRGPSRTVYTVHGRESARITFALMVPFVLRQVQQLARTAKANGEYKSLSQARTRIGNALALRVYNLRQQPEATAHHGTGLNALVPVDLLDDMVAGVRVARSSGKVTTDETGKRYAEEVNLETQVTHQHDAAAKRLAG